MRRIETKLPEEDQAFVDFMAPPEEIPQRQEAGRVWGNILDEVLASPLGENGIAPYTDESLLLMDCIPPHVKKRKETSRKVMEFLNLKKIIKGEADAHLDNLVSRLNPLFDEDIVTQEELDNASEEGSDLEDASIVLNQGGAAAEDLANYFELMIDALDEYYDTEEGQKELEQERLHENTRIYLSTLLPIKKPGLHDLMEMGELPDDISEARVVNAMIGFFVKSLQTGNLIRMEDFFENEDIDKIHYRLATRHIDLYGDGSGYIAGKLLTISEAELKSAMLGDLMKYDINPHVTRFLTLYSQPDTQYEWKVVEPGFEITYELSDADQLMFYLGTPQYMGLYHRNKRPDQLDTHQRLPVQAPEVINLIDALAKHI